MPGTSIVLSIGSMHIMTDTNVKRVKAMLFTPKTFYHRGTVSSLNC
jgi:hypothetical protein